MGWMLWSGVGGFAFADEEDAVAGFEGDGWGLGLRGFFGGFGLGFFREGFEAGLLRLWFLGFTHCWGGGQMWWVTKQYYFDLEFQRLPVDEFGCFRLHETDFPEQSYKDTLSLGTNDP